MTTMALALSQKLLMCLYCCLVVKVYYGVTFLLTNLACYLQIFITFCVGESIAKGSTVL